MTPASGAADHKLSEEKREELGRLVRDVWTHWASSQMDIDEHPNWMATWAGLMEREREVDRMIGTAVYLRAKAEGHSDGSALAALKEKETLQRQYWAVRLLNVQETFGDAFTGVGLRRIALEICPELDAPTMMEVEEKRQALVQKLRAIGTDEVIRAKLDAGTQKQEGAQ